MNGPVGCLPLIYLASPYAHPDPLVRKARYEKAVDALGQILAKGSVSVFCPIAHNHEAAIRTGLPETWEFWREVDFPLLRRSDVMVVLMIDGWEKSVGINAETREAKRCGIPVKCVPMGEVAEFSLAALEDFGWVSKAEARR